MSVIEESKESLFCLLFAKPQMKMALIISLIVGTILNLINQGHLLAAPEKINLINIVLTYCVPFCVATLSSALSTIKHQKKLQLIEENKQICENNFLDYISSNLQSLTFDEDVETDVTTESMAIFIEQFESIEKLTQLNTTANNETEINKIKELVIAGDLSSSFPLLKELVAQFANDSSLALNKNKEKVALLSEQRTQLIEALKVL